jgi:RNA methyltransferase, TrmH family
MRRFIIVGGRQIDRALKGSIQISEVFVCEGLCQTQPSWSLLQTLRQSTVPIQPCTPEVFEKLAFGERAEGLVAVGNTPTHALSDLKLPNDALIAVLVGLEKPGNLGAVLRSADAAGLSAVIVADGGTDLYNPNCIRASLGTVFALPVCEAPSAQALGWLREQKFKLFTARVDGSVEYTQADFRGSTAIVLGSEAIGLPIEWQGEDVTAIQLPMHGVADSLNVSATAAVLFYEALRQRSRRNG